MQKKLIALAVAGLVAAPAFAQSNVTIGGYLSLSYKNMKLGSQNTAARLAGAQAAAGAAAFSANLAAGGTAATATAARNAAVAGVTSVVGFKAENRLDDDWNSRFWLTGSEDLGGGNKAVFRIEQRLNLDMGNTGPAGGTAGNLGSGFAAGESYLGLQTKDFGLFTAGRRHVYFTEVSLWDAVWGQSTSNFTIYGPTTQFFNGGYQNNLTRTNNLLTWQSPVWSGFKARLDYSFNPYGDEGKYATANSDYNKGQLWGATFNYDNGPLSLFFTYVDSNVEGNAPASALAAVSTNDWHGYKGGVKYMLPLGGGQLQLAAILDRSTLENVGTAVANVDLTRTSWLLPIKYITGPHTVSFSYAHAGKTSHVADSKAKMFNLGYQYALSKRSYVGVNYAAVKNDDGAAYQIPLAGAIFSGSGLVAGEKARVLSATFAHMF